MSEKPNIEHRPKFTEVFGGVVISCSCGYSSLFSGTMDEAPGIHAMHIGWWTEDMKRRNWHPAREARNVAVAKLITIQAMSDHERGHAEADDVLCEMLVALGFQDVVDEFNKVKRWYS